MPIRVVDNKKATKETMETYLRIALVGLKFYSMNLWYVDMILVFVTRKLSYILECYIMKY